MKFTATLENLRAGLRAVAPVLPRAAVIDAYQQIHVETTDDGVILTATNGDTWASAVVQADVGAEGATLLPGGTFNDLVMKLKTGPITVTVDGPRADIVAGKVKAQLATMDVSEWPQRPDEEARAEWTVPGSFLDDVAQRHAPATSNETSRPILHNIYWRVQGGRLDAVATSGHILARQSMDVEGPDGEALLHRKVFQDVGRIFGDAEAVRVVRYRAWVGFSSGSVAYLGRMGEGVFPAFEQVLPAHYEKYVEVETAPFRHAVALAMVTADEGTHRVVLDMAGDSMTVSSRNEKGEGAEPVPVADFDGIEFRIGVNAKYLAHFLQQMPTERLRFEYEAPERVVLLRPIWEPDEEPEASGNLLYLVMPLRLLD